MPRKAKAAEGGGVAVAEQPEDAPVAAPAAATVGLDTVKLARFVELKAEIEDMDAMTKAAKEELEALQTELLKAFEATGISGTKINGVTVFMRREVWPKLVEGKTRQDAIKALKEAGLADMVAENYNTQTLRSFITERDKQDEPLPASFEGVIGSTETYTLRTTGAKKGGKQKQG